MRAVMIDGRLVPPEQATISIFDRGFLYGDGLFEVLPTWGDLDAHLDRLYGSAAALRIPMIDRGALVQHVRHAVEAAGGGDRRIRIVVTRGEGTLTRVTGPGRTIIVVEPVGALPRELSAAVVDWPLPRRAGPAHKTLAYLDALVARELASGADEAIRLDADGNVAEGATSNVFIVAGDEVVTPPLDGILPGITRARVLAACAAHGVPCAERSVSRIALAAADEIFVTSAVRGVVAVTTLDGVPRRIGPLTARIAGWIDARAAI